MRWKNILKVLTICDPGSYKAFGWGPIEKPHVGLYRGSIEELKLGFFLFSLAFVG